MCFIPNLYNIQHTLYLAYSTSNEHKVHLRCINTNEPTSGMFLNIFQVPYTLLSLWNFEMRLSGVKSVETHRKSSFEDAGTISAIFEKFLKTSTLTWRARPSASVAWRERYCFSEITWQPPSSFLGHQDTNFDTYLAICHPLFCFGHVRDTNPTP